MRVPSRVASRRLWPFARGGARDPTRHAVSPLVRAPRRRCRRGHRRALGRRGGPARGEREARHPQLQRESVRARAGGAGGDPAGLPRRRAVSRRGDRRDAGVHRAAARRRRGASPPRCGVGRDPEVGGRDLHRPRQEAGRGRAYVRGPLASYPDGRRGGDARAAQRSFRARPAPDARRRSPRGAGLRLQPEQPDRDHHPRGGAARVRGRRPRPDADPRRRGVPPLRDQPGLRDPDGPRPAASEPRRDPDVLQDLRHGRSSLRLLRVERGHHPADGRAPGMDRR